MKIKNITLNGYKRFKKLTIDLGENSKRIVALVGPNGCGKSSVFDGMLFCNNAYGQIGNKEYRDYNYHSIDHLPNYDYQNISINFASGNFQQVREAKRKEGRENTIFSFRSSYRYNNVLNIQETKSVEELRLNNFGATFSSDLDDKMEQNYRRLNIKYNKYLNEKDCKPSEAKAHIIGELNSSISNCLDLIITSIGSIEDNKGTLFFTKSDYFGQEFNFNVLSAGEKEVIDILLDLYLRKDDYNDTVFLLDEPELHINTSIQRKLLIEINKLIGADCQIWIATHSIGFLRALQEELKDECQIIEFGADTPWAKTEQVLKPMQKNRYQWSRIFKTALDDLTGLVSPKRIIYCEGRDKPGKNGQEKGMDAQVYNNIFNEKYPDTLFVSSGGNTELDQRSDIAVMLLTKVFPDIEIWVCKDRDMSSGALNTESERQQYLSLNKETHRVIKRWELENYLYDKEILAKYCANQGLSFAETEYESYVTDINNQQVKDETGRIKNYCNLKVSINPDKFKIELSKCVTSDTSVYKELEDCIFNRL
ncbi:ATP-binding protein [Bacteroides sp. OttesenSCG-928-N06]|nr:ATP-binding protein [Bacteroides sp. OttesenSCG-928-N06]